MKKLIMLIIILSTLTGCWDQKIFEEIGFILQAGIESSEEDSILVTFNYPVIGAESKNQSAIIENKVNLIREAREKSRDITPERLEAGKVQQLLFSEEIPKNGIHDYLELLERDTTNPVLAFVVVVEGSPNKMMKELLNFKDKPRPAFYVNKLLESNIKSSYIPETRIYNFEINSFAPGIDPFTPMIKLESSGVRVIGSALFSGDKMVGKIDTKQTSMLLALMNKMRSTEYNFEAKDLSNKDADKKRGIAALLTNGKSKINIKIKNNKPEININLKLKGTINEYAWDKLDDPNIQKKVEIKLSEEINKECNELIDYLQSIGSDPIGLGEIIRAKYNSYWKGVDWKQEYGDIDINVNVKLNILQFGSID